MNNLNEIKIEIEIEIIITRQHYNGQIITEIIKYDM